jgi:hypothetical protein
LAGRSGSPASRSKPGCRFSIASRTVPSSPSFAVLLAVTTCAISISFRGCLRRCCLVRSLNDFHQFRATPRTLGAPPPSPWHLRYPEPAASPAPGSRAFRERSPPRTNRDARYDPNPRLRARPTWTRPRTWRHPFGVRKDVRGEIRARTHPCGFEGACERDGGGSLAVRATTWTVFSYS